jgi:hypothetical protein
MWDLAPSRAEVQEYIDWQVRQLAKLRVTVHTGVLATRAVIAALAPHDTIIATGSTAAHKQLPLDDGSVRHLDAHAAFAGPPDGKVVVFDEIGDLDGFLVAEFLQSLGRDVTLVTSRIHVGEGGGVNTLFPMLRTLNDRGIATFERYRPTAIEGGKVVLDGVFGAPRLELAADALVSWNGGVPTLDLLDADSPDIGEVSVIGDALRPRRVTDATADAKTCVESVAVRNQQKVRAS